MTEQRCICYHLPHIPFAILFGPVFGILPAFSFPHTKLHRNKRFLSRRQRLFPCCWKPRICRTPVCRSSIRKSHSRKAHHTASVKGNLPYKPFPGFEGHIPTGPVKILFQPQNGLSIWSAKPSSRSRLCCCSKLRA